MSGRYAESKFGEQPVVVATFLPGDTVTIEVLDLSTDTLLTLTSASCSESAVMPGIFYWSTADFQTQPTDFNQLVFRMENAAGLQRPGKIVVGGFPSDSAISRYGGQVHVNDNGNPLTVPGTFEYDIGTEENPVDNFVDARTIADEIGVESYHIHGVFSGADKLAADHVGWTFTGRSPAHDFIEIDASIDVERGVFENLAVHGSFAATTDEITCETCIIGDPAGVGTTPGVRGTFRETGWRGVIQPFDGGRIQCVKGISNELFGTVWDFNSASNLTEVLVDDLVGIWKVRNMVALSVLGIVGKGCELELEATCVNGLYELAGHGELIDGHVGALSFTNRMLSGLDLQFVKDVMEATSVVDQTQDPWEEQWIRQSDSVVLATFELYDETLAAINAGNPITGKRVRRRLKV